MTAAKIVAGSITADELASNSITAAKITSGAVSADKLAANSVTAAKIVSGSITADELASNSVTAAKIVSGVISADKLAANSVTATKITSGAVSADKIASNSITTAKIVSGVVSADKLAANSVTASKIIAGAVSADKIAANAITADKVAANAIEADAITSNAVTADKLAANSVTAAKIVGGTITGDKLVSNTITSDKVDTRNLTIKDDDGNVIFGSGQNVDYSRVGGTKPPANAAVNAPSIGAKSNYLSFESANNGEIYIHGFDAEGQAADIPGYINYNGEQISIKGRILTGNGTTIGFLVYDPDPADLTGYTRPYLVNSVAVDKVFAKKEGQQWSYDNNNSWVPFTPSATAVVFGEATTAASDNVASASAWGYGRSPASIVDPNADVTDYDSELISNAKLNIPPNVLINPTAIHGTNYWEGSFWNTAMGPYGEGGFFYLSTGATATSEVMYQDSIPCAAGTNWTLSAELYSSGNTTGHFAVDVIFRDANNNTTAEGPQVTVYADQSWTRMSGNFNNVAPAGTTQMTVRIFRSNADGFSGVRRIKLERGTNTGTAFVGGSSGATVGADSSNLAVGSGLNLVANASFDEGLQNISFWQPGTVTVGLDYSPSTTLKNGHTVFVQQESTNPDPNEKTNIQFGTSTNYCADNAAVTIGERLEGSLYVAAVRCEAVLLVSWFSSTSVYLDSTNIETIYPGEAIGGTVIGGYKRMGGFVTVPNIADLSYGRLVVQKRGTESGSVDSFLYATRPMLARAFPNQTELSEWNPGTSKTNWENIPDRPSANNLLNNLQTFGDIQGDKPHPDAEVNVGPNLIRNAELGGPKTPASSTTTQVVAGWTHYTNNVSESYVKNATVSEIPPWGKLDQRIFHTAITATLSGATGRWTTAATIPIDITKNYNLSGWFRSVSGDGRVYLRLQCVTASGSQAATRYLQTLSNTAIASTWTRYDKAFGPQGDINFSSDTVAAFVQVYIGYAQISVTQGAGFVLNEGLTPQKIDATEKFALSYLSNVDYQSNFISNKPTTLQEIDATAAAQLDNKTVTYYQNDPPSSPDGGDLWVDTNNSNKLYRRNDGNTAWNLIQDAAAAQQTADAAQVAANTKVTTFYENSAPSGSTGDLWYDTNDPQRRLYRYNGTTWQIIGDQTAYNTAAGFAGQGSLASLNSIGYSSNFITGIRPDADADRTGANTALNVVGQTAFATLAQINAANISTYISGAAIDTAQIKNAAITNALISNLAVGGAQIQNAAITNAKIGNLSVNTAKIADQAVTFPLQAFTLGNINTGTSWVTVQSLTVTNPSGAPVNITCTCAARFSSSGSGSSTAGARLIRNNGTIVENYGSLLSVSSGGVGLGTISLIAQDEPPAGGAVTYLFQIQNTYGQSRQIGEAKARGMLLIETKK